MKIDKLITVPEDIKEDKIYYLLPYPPSKDLAGSMVVDFVKKEWHAGNKVNDISGVDNYEFILHAVRQGTSDRGWLVYEITEKDKKKLLMIEEMLK